MERPKLIKMIKNNGMLRQTRIKDWERTVCEMTDRMVENVAVRQQTLEELLDMIEEMVCNAYIRGRYVGGKK